ncbi:MAG: nucleotidyltransferase family protein [Nitrospinales bacterium]
MIDIQPDQLKIVREILARRLPDDMKVWVFGSRAGRTKKKYSDLDLALESADGKKLPFETLTALQTDFEDSDLPWKVDVLDINAIDPGFRKIVERDRVPLSAGEIAGK